jgi:hypothetical protein
MKQSRGTVWPDDVRADIEARDGGSCVGPRAGFPAEVTTRCQGRTRDIDHIRASGGMGMKSRSTVDNGCLLDPWCHRWKTENGRVARPLLIAWVDAHAAPEHTHVELVHGCADCEAIRKRVPVPSSMQSDTRA